MDRKTDEATRGFTFVEVAVVLTLLTIGFLAQASLTVASYDQFLVNKERRLALEAARSQVEVLKRFDLRTVFPAYDNSKANDPPNAPGPYFDVRGLSPDPNDPSGRVGRVIFPVGQPPPSSPIPDPVLREDVKNPRMGMPADLDGNGKIDDQPKDTTYIHLPVMVEVRWKGRIGQQSVSVVTWLVPREGEKPNEK